MRVLEFNGELRSAAAIEGGLEFSYQSGARALARVDRIPRRVEIDGVESRIDSLRDVVVLPKGQHIVTMIQ
jgi:hypothetical protein